VRPWSNHQIRRSFCAGIGFFFWAWQLCSVISVAILLPLQHHHHHFFLMFFTTFRLPLCSYIYFSPLSSSCSRLSHLSFVPLFSFYTTSPCILLCLFLIFSFILLLLFFRLHPFRVLLLSSPATSHSPGSPRSFILTMLIVLSGSERGTVLVITRSSCYYGQLCSYCTLGTTEMPMTVSNLAFKLTTRFCDLQVVCFGAFKRFLSVTILASITRIYNMAIHLVLDSATEKKKFFLIINQLNAQNVVL